MSNGSEHTPERCEHAVDGPDWAGLREPSSWKERAQAAEEELVALRAQLDSMTVEVMDWPRSGVRQQRLVSPWTVVPNTTPLEVAADNASETGSDLHSEGDDQ